MKKNDFMASCHKKSMSIIFEIPLYHISFSFENRYLQAITRVRVQIQTEISVKLSSRNSF